MDTFSALIHIVEQSKYALLFFGSFFEGTVVMMTGGLLWHTGIVQFWPTYVALYLGDLCGDIAWYLFGYYGGRPVLLRWGHLAELTPKTINKIEERFHRHHIWILVISKLTMGFGLAAGTLSVAGMLRVPLNRFIAINASCGVVWVLFVVLVGYYFGNVLQLVPQQLQLLVAGALLVVAIFVLRYITKRLSKVEW